MAEKWPQLVVLLHMWSIHWLGEPKETIQFYAMLAKSRQFGGREMTVFAGLWYINCLSICFVLAAIGRWWLNDEAAIRSLDLLVTLSGWSGAVVPLRTAGSRIWAAPQQIEQRKSVQRFQVYAS